MVQWQLQRIVVSLHEYNLDRRSRRYCLDVGNNGVNFFTVFFCFRCLVISPALSYPILKRVLCSTRKDDTV